MSAIQNILASLGKSQFETILSIIAYSVCSGSLVLVNKLVMVYYPYPSLVITVQLWAAILIVYAMQCLKICEVDPLRWEYIKPYAAYTFLFALGVYTNMKSLSISNVETVIVARAVCPLIVSFLDVFLLGRQWPSMRSWGALGLIGLGAVGYAATDEQFVSQGLTAYMWPTCYLLVTALVMAYGKKILSVVDLKTLSGPVLYTNILSWPTTLLFAGMGGEFGKFQSSWKEIGIMTILSQPAGMAFMIAGCVVGTAIGYAGWWCRSKVSATSYTIIGVMNKLATVLVNCLIWDQHASGMGIASLFLCLVGGTLYKQAPMRETYQKVLTSEPLIDRKASDVEEGWSENDKSAKQ